MKTSDLEYELPEGLIAQHPADQRDQSRLLVLNREDRSLREDRFENISAYFEKGDCLAINDTKVIRARLKGRKTTGGKLEIFLLHEITPGEWEALVRPSKRLKLGTAVHIGDAVDCTIQDFLPNGRRRISFEDRDVLSTLESVGEIPLPPYIRRDEQSPVDADRYQTVYAATPGAVAAPTAGLHFTPQVFDALDAKGINRATLTLHVGYGTFKPIHADDLSDHTVDPEEFWLGEECANTLNATRAAGGKVFAVGTTSTRVLETQYRDGRFTSGAGTTDHYICPPYVFGGVDALITNFHLPRSSLLALVCAFAGTEFAMDAYRHAVAHDFRFYSYGDAMLIL